MTNERELNKRRKVYINGGCLSKRHAQAAYQKQNRSREPPPRSLISTHASFLHTYYKRLFIVNAESWWRTYFSTSPPPPPPFIIFVDIIHQDFHSQPLENSFASSLDDNTCFWIILRALVSWQVAFSNHVSVSIFMEVVKSSMLHLVHNF